MKVWDILTQLESDNEGVIGRENLELTKRFINLYQQRVFLDRGKKQKEYFHLFISQSDLAVGIMARIAVDLEEEENMEMTIHFGRQSKIDGDPLIIVKTGENSKTALIFVSDKQIKIWKNLSTD